MTSSGARTDAKNKRNRGRVSAILTSPRPMATPSRAPGTPVQAPPPLALRVALRERYAGTFVDTLKDSNAKHARERPVDWLEREIEACYDARLEEDVRTLRSLLNETTATSSGAVEGDSSASVVNGEEAEEESQSFSDFAREYWGRAFGVKALIEKHLWEVVSNAEAARKSKKSECAELFCAFLRRSYDEEALLFFLYCRRWLKYECSLMANMGEMVTKRVVIGTTQGVKHAFHHIDAGIHVSDVSLSAKQAMKVVRAIFNGVGGDGEKNATFLHATVRAMIEDAFNTDATKSWATSKDGGDEGPVNSDSHGSMRMDGYRLLKMLLSVFVDTTPPPDAVESVKQTTRTNRDLRGDLEDLKVEDVKENVPKPKKIPPPMPQPKTNLSNNGKNGAAAEVARYELAVRAALAEAVGKYATALFPKQISAKVIDQAETELNTLAQDLLTKIINNASDPKSSAEVLNEAPAACKSYARARDSIVAGAGTPGAESPTVVGSSTRDVARAILGTPHIKAAIEPMLKSAVNSLKPNKTQEA